MEKGGIPWGNEKLFCSPACHEKIPGRYGKKSTQERKFTDSHNSFQSWDIFSSKFLIPTPIYLNFGGVECRFYRITWMLRTLFDSMVNFSHFRWYYQGGKDIKRKSFFLHFHTHPTHHIFEDIFSDSFRLIAKKRCSIQILRKGIMFGIWRTTAWQGLCYRQYER